ncbi:putative translation elongation factor EF-1, subunit alpha [Dictyocaulus viviparus]|uniref:Putative translation elongation factor EF-1, subunit alpha n=1 Tax=Dictyocaulus viviparus TaxID=29172 RepID=A0A0D8XNM8_DICVI|nr:putative translation elongation factor EF-1, subunit alpha [Dictyocaulus viviparus]
MSSRRRVQKISYSDGEIDLTEVFLELEDDDDYYGSSYEDDVALPPDLSDHIYQRQQIALNTFLLEPKTRDFTSTDQDQLARSPGLRSEHNQTFQTHVDDMKRSQQQLPSTPSSSAVAADLDRTSSLGLSSNQSKCIVQPGKAKLAPTMVEEEKHVIPNMKALRVSTPDRKATKSPVKRLSELDSSHGNLSSNSSNHRLNQLATIAAIPLTQRQVEHQEDTKQLVNLVVVGHVDAGKSTLMGHLLCKLGYVDQRTIHKYKQESARSGKASFAFAWVLDETDEERSRGVTMDIARTSFETDSKRVVLLDAPGHKDFIPNMITGASQADAAILVINSTRGEFETGFESGGQTREHAMLLRSLGIGQLVVAVNKLDTVDWSQERFIEITTIMESFLVKHAGFSKVRFVPVSGLNGDNLTHRVQYDHPLSKWYSGQSLLEVIDSFSSPSRACEGPLRIVISDVIKWTANQLNLSGKVESGEVKSGDKVYLMPTADAAVVKGCLNDGEEAVDHCMAGDQILITLNGTFEPDTIHPGHVIVRGGQDVLIPCRRFVARIVVFNITVPIMKGTKAELYCHSLCESCTVVKLISSINKGSGDVIKERPRFLSKQMSGIVEIETEHEVAIEAYTVCKALGRITIRAAGQTIAAGIVERKLC